MTRLLAIPMLAGLTTIATATAGEAGPLSLQSFFQGPLTARGTVENLRDGTKRDFVIEMVASWTGPNGTLVEDVAYSDGERERKVWHFEKVGDGRFVGRREDVAEDAEVTEDREGVHMVYKAKTRVPPGLSLNLSFDDRLTPVSPGHVVVRSNVTYLFVDAAKIDMEIVKKVAPPAKPSGKAP
ncbi:DUF3833 family protein [Lichenifustis flavocetrariae]|uniref:DUF3833 domain-containing protein n=1 Tax=Lichenifustis flavocetrariae TaxID=2949735 RepID=A0AA42CIK3_9HYPH|nr:DUF3833 family protein [Lichenifustis flavocetrariae]MCW6508479.1 DUF3833 domain-containing protein [Lichenifustis flavocetrariae]